MNETAQQVLVLLLFTIMLGMANLKAGVTWIKFLTIVLGLGTLGLALYLTADWVFPGVLP
jgi:hypothetical protein